MIIKLDRVIEKDINYPENRNMDYSRLPNTKEMISKINEIIEVVNELEKIKDDNYQKLIRMVQV